MPPDPLLQPKQPGQPEDDFQLQYPEPKPKIQTYHKDVAEQVGTYDKGKIADYIQQERSQEVFKEYNRKRHNKMRLLAVLSGLLIVAGVVALVVFGQLTAQPPVGSQISSEKLIPTDQHIRIDTTGFSLESGDLMINLINTLATPQGEVGSITQYDFLGPGILIETKDFLDMVGLRQHMPSILLKTIQPTYGYGSYRIGTRNVPFLVFDVNSFDDALDGMRDWETSMGRNLVELLDLDPALTPENFSTQLLFNRTVRVLNGFRYIQRKEIVPAVPEIETNDQFTNQFTPEGELLDAGGLDGDFVADQPADDLSAKSDDVEYTSIIVQDPGPSQTMLMYMFLDDNLIVITSDTTVLEAITSRFARGR